MKKTLLTIVLLGSLPLHAQTKPTAGFGSEMIGIIQHMKTYTLAIAHQMPQDKYDFTPVKQDTVRSFAEQMKHIIVAINFQTETVLERKEFDPRKTIQLFESYEKDPLTKAEIESAMTLAFDKLLVKLSGMTEEQYSQTFQLPFSRSGPASLRVLAMFVRDHITHHRAQAIVYLRMNGIEPAFYQPF